MGARKRRREARRPVPDWRVLWAWTGHWLPDLEAGTDDPERMPIPRVVYLRIFRWLFVNVQWGLNRGRLKGAERDGDR